MTIFGEARGTFKIIDLDTSNGKGVQISIPGGNPVGNSSLVTSFSAVQNENFSVSQCLNGGVFLYTFGHDPQRSQFSVGVTSFLRSCKGDMGEDLASALELYRGSRVSQKKQKSSLSVGNAVFKGYLIGQGVDVVDSQLGIINTTYSFIALDAH